MNKRGRIELETSGRKSCKCISKEVRVRTTVETVWERGGQLQDISMQETEADGKMDQKMKEFIKELF